MASYNYINDKQASNELMEFGRYSVLYSPPEGSLEPDITMSISGEGDLHDLLRLFTAFLRASGHDIGERRVTLDSWPDTENSVDPFWDTNWPECPESDPLNLGIYN